VDPREQYKKH